MVDHEDDYRELAQELGEAKSELDGFDDAAYRRAQWLADPYAPLKKLIRDKYHGECVSNAWLKMRELSEDVFEDHEAAPVTVFANAELPGAFVKAMLHYAHDRDFKMNWIASSLLATDDTPGKPLGDAYWLYQKHRKHWLMDRDCDGDLTNPDTVLEIAARAVSRDEPITIYTSDGGIDVSANYNEQEALNFPLHFGQAICGLLVLAPGGTMLLKQYTHMNKDTRMLITFIKSKFKRFRLCKPATSRPGNSEMYLLGKGYRGLAPGERARLEETLREGRVVTEIPEDVSEWLYEHALEAFRRQRAHLQRLVSAAEGKHIDKTQDKAKRDKWLAKMRIKVLRR